MLVLKGFIIGLGKIIPGVSGSMLAISLGLYEKMISAINNFFKDIINNSKFLMKVLIGVLISIILFSKVVVLLLNKYYVITIFSFVGLICGSLSDIKKEINLKKDYILIIPIIILLIIINYLTFSNDVDITNSFVNFIYWIFAGFVEAISTVVPGISGTSMLMMIGAYDKLILAISNLFSIDTFAYNLPILLPFLIGMIGGVFIISKIISYLFSKHKEKTYSLIYAFSISSILLMLINCFSKTILILDIIVGLLFFTICFYLSKKVNHLSSD